MACFGATTHASASIEALIAGCFITLHHHASVRRCMMIEERDTEQMELISFAAKMALEERIGANKKSYFNTSLGSFMRNVLYVFQSINVDTKLDKGDRNPEYIWSLVNDVKAQIDRDQNGRFDDERDTLRLFEGVTTAYREYVARRDDIDLDEPAERSLGR
jgi:hypothetical protein